MMVKVVVRGSPYRSVSVGAVGQVISKQYVGTKIEQWKVLFSNGVTWTFYPDELEVLNAEKEKRRPGARRSGRTL